MKLFIIIIIIHLYFSQRARLPWPQALLHLYYRYFILLYHLMNLTISHHPMTNDQANPGLRWYDVQDILVKTARVIHEDDPGWHLNGGGMKFHHLYG